MDIAPRWVFLSVRLAWFGMGGKAMTDTSTDIVERLRDVNPGYSRGGESLEWEAADEIDRLRALLRAVIFRTSLTNQRDRRANDAGRN